MCVDLPLTSFNLNRKGPYGVPDTEKVEPSISITAPFPQPLLTRQSFKQDIVQPPLPKASRRLRQCRRQVGRFANGRKVSKLLAKKQFSNSFSVSRTSSQVKASSSSLGKRKKETMKAEELKLRKLKKVSVVTESRKTLPCSVKHLISHSEPIPNVPLKASKVVLQPFNISHADMPASALPSPPNGLDFKSKESSIKDHKANCEIIDLTSDNEDILKVTDCRNLVDNHAEHCGKLQLGENSELQVTNRKPSDAYSYVEEPELSCNYVESELPIFPCSDSDISPHEHEANNNLGIAKNIVENESTATSNKKRPKRSPKSLHGTITNTTYVTSCKTVAGATFTQGDIVWSKLTGHPWWPSRIVKLIVTKTDGESLLQEAKIGWFRSKSTSTLSLNCLQRFEEHFDAR